MPFNTAPLDGGTAAGSSPGHRGARGLLEGAQSTLGARSFLGSCLAGANGGALTSCGPASSTSSGLGHAWGSGEHDVPESQCFICHPDLSFEPLPTLAANADLKKLSAQGEDVADLTAHAVPGKVTVFDFYADWCPPCRKVDAHMYGLLNQRPDIAYRKLNVVSWDTPLARRYLQGVPNLPHLVIYGRDGRPVRSVTGLDLAALDAAIAEGAAR